MLLVFVNAFAVVSVSSVVVQSMWIGAGCAVAVAVAADRMPCCVAAVLPVGRCCRRRRHEFIIYVYFDRALDIRALRVQQSLVII